MKADWKTTPPKTTDYILLSFSNMNDVMIGRYEYNNYYIGDDDITAVDTGLYVNAWAELPKPYRERHKEYALPIMCEENCLCADCKDKNCLNHGMAISDCPRIDCEPMRQGYDADYCDCGCEFMAKYQAEMREFYKESLQ